MQITRIMTGEADAEMIPGRRYRGSCCPRYGCSRGPGNGCSYIRYAVRVTGEAVTTVTFDNAALAGAAQEMTYCTRACLDRIGSFTMTVGAVIVP